MKIILILLPTILLFSACDGFMNPQGVRNMPELEAPSVTVRNGTAKFSAKILKDVQAVSGCGFLLDDNGAERRIGAEMDEKGNFSATVTGLKPLTTYGCSAFISNGRSEIMSEKKKFTTQKSGMPEIPADSSCPITVADPYFMSWLLPRYDKDGNGYISASEAMDIESIELKTTSMSSASGIEWFSNLNRLVLQGDGKPYDAPGNGLLSEIDLSSTPCLTDLELDYNRISSIDLSWNPALVFIGLTANRLTALDLSCNHEVQRLCAGFNLLKTIDLSDNPVLDEVHLEGNMIESVTLCNGGKLRYLDCHRNHLESLDLSGCLMLDAVDCTENPYLKTIRLKKGQIIGTLLHDESAEILRVD